MSLQEQARRLEFTAELDQWVEEIQKRWGKAPEFRPDPLKLRHLAIICDGNRRAAQQRSLPSYFGHRAGVEAIKGVAKACRKWDIKTLTFWVWSTENWQRDQEQVDFVMNLADHFLRQQELLDELMTNNVRFKHLGRKDRLPESVVNAISNLEAKTVSFNKYHLNLALDYGGLDEIVRAILTIQRKDVNPVLFRQHPNSIINFLDTAGQDLPDLVVRTGMQKGEFFRTSGFMPLQTAYAVWLPVRTLFPDLTPHELKRGISSFIKYQRRFGA